MNAAKKRILCFGDSNTWGYRGGDAKRFPEDVRWTGRLQTMLGEGYTVIEEGHNGRTTVWDDPVENRLAGLTYLWPCMDSQSPFDLIIIMVGTNDLKSYFGMEAGSIATGAGRLVQTAMGSAFGPDGKAPQVLLVSPIRVLNSPEIAYVFGSEAERKSNDFSRCFAQVAKDLGCHFMDAAEVAQPAVPDGVHLDPEGHRRMAQAMYDKVKEILG